MHLTSTSTCMIFLNQFNLFYLIFLSCRFILCSHIGNHIANTVGVVLVIIGLVMMIILNSLLLEFNFRTLLLSLVQSDGKKKSKKKLCPCIKWNRTREKEPLLQVYLLFFNIDVFFYFFLPLSGQSILRDQ